MLVGIVPAGLLILLMRRAAPAAAAADSHVMVD
jgi:hypothetical protein